MFRSSAIEGRHPREGVLRCAHANLKKALHRREGTMELVTAAELEASGVLKAGTAYKMAARGVLPH